MMTYKDTQKLKKTIEEIIQKESYLTGWKNLLYLMWKDITRYNFQKLSEREQAILLHRFGLGYEDGGKTLEETAKIFGITRERIRQLQTKAIKKLRMSCIENYRGQKHWKIKK